MLTLGNIIARSLKTIEDLLGPTAIIYETRGDGEKKIISRTIQRRALIWETMDEQNKYDDRLAQELCQKGIIIHINFIFGLTESFIESNNLSKEVQQKFHKPSDTDDIFQKLFWAIKVLTTYKVISYFYITEYQVIENSSTKINMGTVKKKHEGAETTTDIKEELDEMSKEEGTE